MKMVIAFVQQFMAPHVIAALHQVPELTGATFTDVKGFGRGRTSHTPDPELLYGTAEKVRVEVMVRDDMEHAVVQAIREAGHTGNRGDGKIYVIPVDRAVRIATGQEGENVA